MSPTDDLDIEIKALQSVFNTDTEFARITEHQLAGLNSLFQKGLTNPANRIPVVKLITGLKRLTSTKQLTFHTAHTLISELKFDEEWNLTPYGRWLIQACEKRVEELAGSQPLGNHSLRDASHLPDLP